MNITTKEMEVYNTLLNVGACTISTLANKVKMNQRSVYDYIERLIYKGLVGQMWHNNVRQFLALNPKILKFNIDEEKEKIKKESLEINKLLLQNYDGLKINIIEEKHSLFRIIKELKGKSEVFMPTYNKELLNNPSFKYFILKNNPVIKDLSKGPIKSKASCLIIFIKDYFIIFSLIENKGFYVINKDFSKSMKVYFN